MLQLNLIDIATEEDISNNLAIWANLFNATTWEEFKALAKDYTDIKIVTSLSVCLERDVTIFHGIHFLHLLFSV